MGRSTKRKSASKGKSPKKAKNDDIDRPDDDLSEEPVDADQYVVESVVDKRRRNGKTEYLIKWQGYADEDNTWEPEDNLECEELIEEYEQKVKTSTQKSSKSSSPAKKSTPAAKKPTTVSTREDVGFARGFEAEKIIGVTELNGDLLYLIQWQGGVEADLVPANIANHKCPQVVIQFFQEKLRFTKRK